MSYSAFKSKIMHSRSMGSNQTINTFNSDTPISSERCNSNSSNTATFCLSTPLSKVKSTTHAQSSSCPRNQSSTLKRPMTTPGFTTSRTSCLSSTRTPFHAATPSHMESSTIAAIVEGRGLAKGEIGMASMSLKGSELTLFQFSDGASYMKLLTKLNIVRPIEVILPSTTYENGNMATLFDMLQENYPNANFSTVQRRYFNESSGLQYVKDLCAVDYKTVELAIKSKYYCLATAAALLKYIEFIQNIVFAPNALKIVFKGSENTTMIDASVAKHLELVQNSKDPRSSHSLFGVMNHTKTPGGARFLRANILQPPSDAETINIRLRCIEELIDNEELFLRLQTVLSKFLDVEHLISLCIQIPKREDTKAAEMKITEMIHLKHTLELVAQFRSVIKEGSNPLFIMYYKALEDNRFDLLLETIQAVINDDTMIQKGTLNMRTQKVFLIKPGINGMLDVVRKVYTECIDDIAEMIKQLADRYTLNLKPAYNTSRGFFIQICDTVPVTSLPNSFVKIVQTKSSLTCTTEDLIKMNGRVTEALNEIYILSNMVISQLLVNIRENISCMYRLAEGVSTIDMIVSFAHACSISNYVCPEFTDTLAIKQGRNPILEKLPTHKTMVPNDVFASDANNFVIITGPNMSGKSTYLKQIVLLQVMAQVGSFVPAEYASFRLTDHIFARVGTDDDIETNSSTFTLEMKEINYILKNATNKSLIIIDELGRGTSIDEGVGICYSSCEHLLQLKAITFFATHFTEICQLEALYPNVENFHMEVKDPLNSKERMVFKHTISKGKTPQVNYGIRLAEMSALPKIIIDTAVEHSIRIRSRGNTTEGKISKEANRRKAVFRLGTRLLQVARYSKLDEGALRVYLQGLKEHFLQEISDSNEGASLT